MAVSGVIKVMKWVLIVFNVLILCAGAIAIGLGAWGLGSEYGAEKLRDLTGSELYKGAAIAIIVGGSVLVIISFIGAAGAFLENKWLLGTYFVIELLLLILFVTSAAVGFAYRDELEEELSRQMEYSLVYKYGVDIDDNDDNFRVTDVWDGLQKKLDCCGVIGGRNSQKSWFLWQSSQWYKDLRHTKFELVPSSCCVREQVNSQCQQADIRYPNRPPQFYYNVTEDNPELNAKGCITAVKDYIFDRAVAVAGISIAILIVMFLCLLLAVCVCTNIKKTKTDRM